MLTLNNPPDLGGEEKKDINFNEIVKSIKDLTSAISVGLAVLTKQLYYIFIVLCGILFLQLLSSFL